MKTKSVLWASLAMLYFAACQPTPQNSSQAEQAQKDTVISSQYLSSPASKGEPDPAVLQFLAYFEDWAMGEKYSSGGRSIEKSKLFLPVKSAQKYLGETIEYPEKYGKDEADYQLKPLGRLILPSKKYAILHYMHMQGDLLHMTVKMVVFDLKNKKVTDQIDIYEPYNGLCSFPAEYRKRIENECDMSWRIGDTFQVTDEDEIRAISRISCPDQKSFSCEIRVDESTGRFVR